MRHRRGFADIHAGVLDDDLAIGVQAAQEVGRAGLQSDHHFFADETIDIGRRVVADAHKAFGHAAEVEVAARCGGVARLQAIQAGGAAGRGRGFGGSGRWGSRYALHPGDGL